MKNRTVIGIVCIVLACAAVFLLTPLLASKSAERVSIPTAGTRISRGSIINEKDIKYISLPKDAIPSGILTKKELILGHYAATDIYSGDYIRKEQLSTDMSGTTNVLESLDGTKFAMSFTIDSFAAGLSGKILNGDIISLIVSSRTGGGTFMPPELRYVRVITTTTSGGVDRDKLDTATDGTTQAPSTVTLLLTRRQAKLLAEYEDDKISCALVYRGEYDEANRFISAQDEYLEGTNTDEEDDENPYESILEKAEQALEMKLEKKEGETDNG